ncbi:MAG TPA: tetratricopeptide repeat protein [Polyangiaceae bacterium]|nr:tetratricopeptide repeat protein [Polyangiaceae bacterium]
MDRPRALVIPFGVPESKRGLGLGLASLVHAFARVEDGAVGLAQIRHHGADGGVTGMVEAFVTPEQWRAMPGADETPSQVSFILTGSFDPPSEGRGSFALLAFDPKTGAMRARAEAVLDADQTGRSIVETLGQLCARVGGELGALRGLEPLGWDALESVLFAETWHIRARSGSAPGAETAALVHLARAVGEAKDAAFPAERLAAIAVETAHGSTDARAIEGALRTLTTAASDAPDQASLAAASAAVCMRLGRPAEAEGHAARAVTLDAKRALSHALLAGARRAGGDFDGAREAIEAARSVDAIDPHVQNEHAMLLAAAGDSDAACAEWTALLARFPMHLGAFASLAEMALSRRDAAAAQLLVDHALGHRGLPTEMLRRAVQLALAAETAGVARASRIAALCKQTLEREPNDGVATILLARAMHEMGDHASAFERLRALESAAAAHPISAEAARVRLQLENPLAAASVEATVRAAIDGDAKDLEAVAARARRLAVETESWVAHIAVAVAERRLGHLERAKQAAFGALALAPASAVSHLEMASVLLAAGDSAAATHARRAGELDPSSSRAFAVLAEALIAAGNREGARAAIDRALQISPADARAIALRERLAHAGHKGASWIDRLLGR